MHLNKEYLTRGVLAILIYVGVTGCVQESLISDLESVETHALRPQQLVDVQTYYISEETTTSYELPPEDDVDSLFAESALEPPVSDTGIDSFLEIRSVPSGVDAYEAFKEVLTNQSGFVVRYGGADVKIYLDDYVKATHGITSDPIDLVITFVDLDDDGLPEVILERENPINKVILTYKDGAVIGGIKSYKQLSKIKQDGTFTWGYANYNGYGKLRLLEGYYEVIELASFEYISEQKACLFLIDNCIVSFNEYELYCNAQDAKEDIEWFCFNAFLSELGSD